MLWLNQVKDTVDVNVNNRKYNFVAIKVYTISTKLKVHGVREPWCWAKALNMFLDEIYYQNAAHYILNQFADEKPHIMVKSPEGNSILL